jgi:GntR family transcriptional regulator / MocR family aminotransferase
MRKPWASIQPELLVPLERGTGRALRSQIEDRLRAAIRAGTLGPGSRLPSSRVLARDLGLSRGLVVEAYAQLAAEGYLEASPGGRTRVVAAVRHENGGVDAEQAGPLPRYDFRPGVQLDRHLPRALLTYRARRDALMHALAELLPGARVRGIAAGLHAVVELPPGADEEKVVAAAARRDVRVYAMGGYHADGRSAAPALVLGYAALPEPAIRSGIGVLAEAVADVIKGSRLPSAGGPVDGASTVCETSGWLSPLRLRQMSSVGGW